MLFHATFRQFRSKSPLKVYLVFVKCMYAPESMCNISCFDFLIVVVFAALCFDPFPLFFYLIIFLYCDSGGKILLSFFVLTTLPASLAPGICCHH